MKDISDHIGFGCVGLSAQPGLKKANHLLESAFNEGVRLFDTAPLYGNGYSEYILGNFIRDKRKEVQVTTKFGLGTNKMPAIPAFLALPLNYGRKMFKKRAQIPGNNSVEEPGLLPARVISKDALRIFLERSLLCLKTDYIDNYLLHEGVPSFLEDDAKEYLFECRNKGMIKKIGIATSSVHTRLIDPVDVHGWDILQYENGPYFKSDDLVAKFPGMVHIYHSALKNLQHKKNEGPEMDQVAAMILAAGIRKNPGGKILFSSSSSSHIARNIALVKTYLKDPVGLSKDYNSLFR